MTEHAAACRPLPTHRFASVQCQPLTPSQPAAHLQVLSPLLRYDRLNPYNPSTVYAVPIVPFPSLPFPSLPLFAGLLACRPPQYVYAVSLAPPSQVGTPSPEPSLCAPFAVSTPRTLLSHHLTTPLVPGPPLPAISSLIHGRPAIHRHALSLARIVPSAWYARFRIATPANYFLREFTASSSPCDGRRVSTHRKTLTLLVGFSVQHWND